MYWELKGTGSEPWCVRHVHQRTNGQTGETVKECYIDWDSCEKRQRPRPLTNEYGVGVWLNTSKWMQTESKSRSLTNWVRNFTDNWLRFDFTKRRAYRRPHFTPSFVTFTSDLSKSMVTEDGYAYCWANGAYTQFKLCDILFLNTHGWLRNTDVHLVTLIF